MSAEAQDEQEHSMSRDELVPRLLRVEEAADVLAISRTKVYELMASGELESVHIGRSRRVPVDAVRDFVARLRSY